MKKLLYLIIFAFLSSFFFLGCSLKEFNLPSNKPNNFYYTNKLAKSFAVDKIKNCTVLDTNFYKEKKIAESDIQIINSFLKSLNKDNFLNENKDLNTKPKYKIFLTFEKEKFVINVYDEKYITIQPWDGDYSLDYIQTTGIPLSYSLYNLCSYIINNYN